MIGWEHLVWGTVKCRDMEFFCMNAVTSSVYSSRYERASFWNAIQYRSVRELGSIEASHSTLVYQSFLWDTFNIRPELSLWIDIMTDMRGDWLSRALHNLIDYASIFYKKPSPSGSKLVGIFTNLRIAGMDALDYLWIGYRYWRPTRMHLCFQNHKHYH